MTKEKNIEELLDKISGGYNGLDLSQNKEEIIRALIDETNELAKGIIEDKDIDTLCSYLRNLNMSSAISFLKGKLNNCDILTPEGERLMELYKCYMIANKLLKL